MSSRSNQIVCGLAAVDVVALVLLFLLLRSQRFLDRQGRVITASALSGFVFHAVLFFEGPILYLHLATLAVIYFALAVWPVRRKRTNAR